ncbi:MAG: Gfo/Idh/MocA family oxidoreductase [Candidatus Poribacteria bacterium]|nr:Gfo/Idh/MocA family oxidoreductase [Candidatus Poribacteria bacterium]
MSKYRTAIVGGRRGVHHARCYEGIDNMQVIALCEIDENRLRGAVNELNVNGYTDYEEMLKTEKPDIVHAVTAPTVPRHIWVEPAADAGVKALVIEKPIALRPSEAENLATAHEKTGLKIIVNHQRRYLHFAEKMLEFFADGSLGDIHFIRACTQGEITDMDTHLMDVVLLALKDISITHVWGTVEGGDLYDTPILQCPENLMAIYTFENGTRVFFESARKAFGTIDFPGSNPRCNLDFWATKGRMWWRENGSWGYHLDGMEHPIVEETHFGNDDKYGQRAFTQAIATWLDDENQPHRNRLEFALHGFDLIMAAYRSALIGDRIAYPPKLTDEEWVALKNDVLNNR